MRSNSGDKGSVASGGEHSLATNHRVCGYELPIRNIHVSAPYLTMNSVSLSGLRDMDQSTKHAMSTQNQGIGAQSKVRIQSTNKLHLTVHLENKEGVYPLGKTQKYLWNTIGTT